MRRALLLGLLLAAAGYAVAGGFTASGDLEIRPFQQSGSDRLEARGAVIIKSSDPRFGGFSGMLADGPEVVAVTDRANWGRISLRIEGGRLEGVNAVATDRMMNAAGNRAKGYGWDSEGLARLPDGRLVVSFERDHRLQIFDSDAAPAGDEFRDPSWERFDLNGGLEGLATDDAGLIWAIRESADADGTHPVFVGPITGPWERKRIEGRGEYEPTGADFGPDGWLYVSERAFGLLTGFSTRLRRFRWGADPDPLEDETLGVFPSSDGLDNVEGISVWRDGEGEILILLLSDDNFSVLENTVFSLFALR